MRNVHRVTLVLAGLGLSTTLLASLDSQKDFLARYPDAKAKLGKCSTCHTAPMPKKDSHDLNAFGKDLEKACVDPKAPKKERDWSKVEGLDSDGDGVKNLDEIKAGTPPGAK